MVAKSLYLTPLKRLVIDDHSWEAFGEGDVLLATKEELTNGIKLKVFLERLCQAKKGG